MASVWVAYMRAHASATHVVISTRRSERVYLSFIELVILACSGYSSSFNLNGALAGPSKGCTRYV